MKGKVFGSIYTHFCFIYSGKSKKFKKQKSDTNIYNKHFTNSSYRLHIRE